MGKNNEHFCADYFTGKPLDELKKTIKPCWENEDNKAAEELEIINIGNGYHKILEIGCGIGRLLKPLSEREGVVAYGVDASQDMIEHAQVYAPQAKFFKCPPNGLLPASQELFDCVFSFLCFQHIQSTETVKNFIREAYRVTMPGGIAIFQFLNFQAKHDPPLWNYHNIEEVAIAMLKIGYNLPVLEYHENWAILRSIK